MPLQLPPEKCGQQATTEVLPAGTQLWRVHTAQFPVDSFNPVPANAKIGGGRFDCTEVRRYPYLYASPEQSTALIETVARSIPFHQKLGTRTVRRAMLKPLRLSALELTRDLRVLRLVDRTELGKICTDEWLVQTESINYDITRRWAMWLHERDWAEQTGWRGAPAGLLWESKRDQPRHAVMFFGDRCADAVRAVPDLGFCLADPDCHDRLAALFADYGLTLNRGGKQPPKKLEHRDC
ncbi:RES family NAD+ phosphorylase [Streptosporangiaceae bacterium NEAU-GS5]|nr:RES family NAD+ phosphorylase [Streptosporangiaceae bacterium NEAU-GS5]